MRFSIRKDQELLVEQVSDFAKRRIAPSVSERDEKEWFDRSLYDEMRELSLPALAMPQEYGGKGLDYLSLILALEELAKVDDSLSASVNASVLLCQWPILRYGSALQKQKFLLPLVSGEKLGAFALTEPNAGTDAANLETKASFQKDCYVLSGRKVFITNGGEADIYLIFAATDRSRGAHGISAFLVEKGMQGFSFGDCVKKMGLHGSATCELKFDNMVVPKENRVGKEGEGFEIAMSALDGGRIGVAAQAVGIAQAAFAHALAYSRQRIQFGKPIANMQAVAFMLADMETKIGAARLLTYQAAWAKDQGLSFRKEAARAKMYASDIAMSVASDAVQIFGGNGFLRDYPVERLLRNAKITQIYEGTNQVQRIVISQEILR